MKKITEDGEIVDELCEDCTPIPVPPIFLKTPHNHDTNVEAARTALTCKDKSLTQQQFKTENDVKSVLEKFLNTGGTPADLANSLPKGQYLDIDQEYDLQDSIVTRAQVDEAWNALPVAVRNILRSPEKFVEYIDHCMQTGDLDPLRELGLANAKPPEHPETPKVVTPAPEAPKPGDKAPEKAPT